MFTPRRLPASSFLLLCLLTTGLAQSQQPASVRQVSPTSTTVTASAAAERVRFTAPSNVVRMQLQVVSESGQILFDVSSKGNVLDWSLQDSSGQRLQGSYVTVVTVKSLSGKLSERIGLVSIGEKQVELQRADTTQLSAAQQQAVGPIEENATLTILQANEAEATTVLSNNGSEGQIIRDLGALSFRLGNFFSGNDKEQMRLTEEGNLGIGTDQPQAKLDVAGTIRTTKGIEFADGTVQTTGLSGHKDKDGNVVPAAAGTGTQNRIAKWTDSAGTLGDSLLNEAGGGVELRSVAGGSGINPTFINPNNAPGFSLLQAYPATGPNTNLSFAVVPRGTGVVNNRAQLTLFNTDFIADSSNYEFAALRARGPDFVFGTGRSGTGVNRPFMLASGFLADNTTNNGQLYLATNGNVGIGNTAPGAKLDVTGNINTSTQYNIGGNHALSAPGLNNIFAGSTAGASNTSGDENSFFGVSAGNNNLDGHFNSFVGVGAGFGNTAGNRNTALGYLATFGSNSLTNATAIGAQARVNQSNSLVLGSVNGVNSATANTNVGIGINAPSATLHVVAYTNSSGENTATFQAPNIGSNQSHIHFGTTGDWYIRSAANAGKVILQDTGGNVGIGTGSPAAKLDVRDGTGASGTGGHIQIGAPVANADEKIIGFGDLSCGAVFSSPCVYIGEKDADDRLVLRANEVRFIAGNVLPDSDNIQSLGGSLNRWTAVWAANGTIQTSDARLKQRIANLKYGLSQVMQLRPVSFEWKDRNDKSTHLGLIAQEVDTVLPEAVQKSTDADAPLGMNYSTLIPVLIKAIQEQQSTLERTQAEIKTLRAENVALSRRIVLWSRRRPERHR